MVNSSTDPRIRKNNTVPGKQGKCVVYVMSRDQRVRDNHALLAAQRHAIEYGLPLAVAFCLYNKVRYRAREHFRFMVDGLRQVEADLAEYNIPFMLFLGDPLKRIHLLAHYTNPEAIYLDFNPLYGPTALQAQLAKSLDVPQYTVDTHNIVPAWLASDKQEVGARTLRPKIHKQLDRFVIEPQTLVRHPILWPGTVMSINELHPRIDTMLAAIASNGVHVLCTSGENAAHRALETFVATRLRGYAVNRNDPSILGTSDLSPYLHFGQLASLRVVLRVQQELAADESLRADVEALIEEIVIRKELSDNFCAYGAGYKRLDAAPAWAQATLAKHTDDQREFEYSREQFEQAATHDPAWNAAQRQLLRTGKIHGYMRMYWAKKVLEWSASPQEAIDTLIYLNDFYSIDGGDPNGYVGILWSVAGVHDRPWAERPVYGTVRSMVYAGLKRKFDIEKYIEQNS